MIGRYVNTLPEDAEDRVLLGRLGAARHFIRADGCRCLIGCTADAQGTAGQAGWRSFAQSTELFRSLHIGPIGQRFDKLCGRFGDARIANVIRDRILSNRARRVLADVPVLARSAEEPR